MCSFRNIFEADDIRFIEDIHIEKWKSCNVEISSKTKVDNRIASVYKTIQKSLIPINTEYAVTYLMTLIG